MLLVHVNELEDEKALIQNFEVKPTCNYKLLSQTVAELGVVIFNALDFGLKVSLTSSMSIGTMFCILLSFQIIICYQNRRMRSAS